MDSASRALLADHCLPTTTPLEGFMSDKEHTEHQLLAEGVGHVHSVDRAITVQADLVRCYACEGHRPSA
jgi:hypothetical protein